MPVEIERVKAAKKPLDTRVREFLDSNPAQAFTLYEIIAGVEGYPTVSDAMLSLMIERQASTTGRSETWDRYENALRGLEQAKVVISAELRGSTYYGPVTPT